MGNSLGQNPQKLLTYGAAGAYYCYVHTLIILIYCCISIHWRVCLVGFQVHLVGVFCVTLASETLIYPE